MSISSLRLRIRSADGTEVVRTFDASPVTIGREQGDLVVPDREVSSRHGELSWDERTVWYRDLGSTNGSRFPDGRVMDQPVPLAEGDAVALGGVLLVVDQVVRSAPAVAEGAKGRTMFAPMGVAPLVPPRAPAFAPTPGLGTTPVSPAPADAGPSTQVPAEVTGAPAEATASVTPPPSASVMPPTSAVVTPPPSAIVTAFEPPPGLIVRRDDDLSPRVFFSHCVDLFRPHLVRSWLTAAIVLVPVAYVSAFAAWVPWLLLPATLVSLAASPLVAAASGRFALGVAFGQPIEPAAAWRESGARVGSDWPNIFVFSIIAGLAAAFFVVPGILLGAVVVPIYLYEGRTYLDAVGRNLELVRPVWTKVLWLAFVAFVLCIPAFIVLGLVSTVLGLVPVLGPLLAALINGLFQALLSAFGSLAITCLYLALRGRQEQLGAGAPS